MKISLFILILSLLTCKCLSKKALAFGGGGLKSVSDQSAIVASLIAARASRGGDATLTSTGLMDNVDSIAGISGGSWFSTNLAFSEQFRKMVESIAQYSLSGELSKIKSKFIDDYAQTLIDAADNSEGIGLPLLTFLTELIGDPGLIMFIDLVSRIFETKNNTLFTWRDMMPYVVPGVPEDTTFSDEPQEWAIGKNLAICAAAAMPPVPEDSFLLRNEYVWWDRTNLIREQYLMYSADLKSGEDLNRERSTPVVFSHTLGSPDGTEAPFPFVAPALNDFNIKYSGVSWCRSCWLFPDRFEAEYNGSIAPKTAGGTSFSNTPLYGPLAASSAAAAVLSSNWATTRLAAYLRSDTTVKFSPALEGINAFDTPQSLTNELLVGDVLKKETIDAMAEIGTYSLYDGGLRDILGIGGALATGATEIVVFNSFWFFDFRFHFRDAPKIISSLYPGMRYPLFQETYSYATEAFDNFSSFSIPEGNEMIDSVEIGTLYVTTCENDDYGLEGGRPVKLHVVNTFGDVTIFFDDYENYGDSVQQLVATLTAPENEQKLDQMLEMFA